MSTWFEKFSADLAAINARRSTQTRSMSNRDVAMSVLANMSRPNNNYDYRDQGHSSTKGGLSLWWDTYRDQNVNTVGRVFDVLSRGLYGITNPALDETKAGKAAVAAAAKNWKPGDPLPTKPFNPAGDSTVVDSLKSMWEGVSGHDKTVSQDVFREQGVTNKFALGAGGFASDVLADPLNLVDPLAVARRLGIKGVSTGAKNAIESGVKVPVVNPSTKIESDLARTGQATFSNTPVNEKIADDYLKKSNAVKPATVEDVVNVVPNTATLPDPADFRPSAVSHMLQIGPAPETTFVVDSAGNAVYKPWHNMTERLGIESRIKAKEAARSKILTGVETRNYPKSTKIAAPFTDGVTIKNEKYIEKIVEDNPNSPLNKSPEDLLKDEIKAAAKTHAIGGGGGEGGFKIFGRTGAAPMQGAPQIINWATVLKLSKAAKLPTKFENVTVKAADGSIKPLKTLIQEIQGNAVRASNTVIGPEGQDLTTITREIEKTRPVAEYSRRRMTPSEMLAWRQKHIEAGISDAHLAQISRVTGLGEKAVQTTIDKILSGTGTRDFANVQELAAAVKKGQLTERETAALRMRLSDAGVKNLGQLERDLSKLRSELLKAQKMEPVQRAVRKGRPTAAAKAAAAEVKAEAHSPAAYTNLEEDILNTPSVVSDTATKVEKAYNGDVTDFAREPSTLTELQAKAVSEALKVSNLEDLQKPLTEWKGTTTRTGARRTDSTPGVGRANYVRGYNAYNQYTLGKTLINYASKMVQGTKDAARPAAMYDNVVPMLKAAEATLRERGIMPTLGFGKTGLPLSLGDVLEALPREYVEKTLFLRNRAMDMTQFLKIAEQFIHVSLGKRDIATAGTLVDELIRKPGTKGRKSPLTLAVEGNPELGKQAYKETVDAFMGAAPKLIDALTTNSARAVIKVGDETKALTMKTIEDFNQFVTNPAFGPADILGYTADLGKHVDEAAKAMPEMTAPAAVEAAKSSLIAHAAEKLGPDTLAAMATARKGAVEFAKVAAGKSKSDYPGIAAKLLDSTKVEAAQVLKEMGLPIFDLGLKADYTFGINTLRKMFPHLSNHDIRPILTERMSVNQVNAKKYTVLLGNLAQKYSKEDIRQAFATLQINGVPSTPVETDLAQAVSRLFANPESADFGIITRNGLRVEHVNEKMKRFGIGDHFRLDPKDIEGSWRKWTVEDPLDLLSRYHAAVAHAVAEQQLGAEIVSEFGSLNPIKGGARLVDSKGKSKIYALVGGQHYFPEDIVRQLHAVDQTLKELDAGLGSSKFIRVIDGAMHMYKSGLTIYRPGHHTRNMVGDMWFSSLDGVKGSSYKKAIGVLATRSNMYKDYDAMAAFNTAFPTGEAPKAVVTMRYKGKDIKLGPEDLYRLGYERGILPDYSILEDINFGEVNSPDISARLKKVSPFKGKLHKAATGLSEYRDHYVRMAHFISVLEQNPNLVGPDLNTALKNATRTAGIRVRKWHPDGSDLSQWEKRYARRTILFYSWMRKAIPLVIEAAATKPGRVMLYPKAMYNIAEMNGVDLESYGNPFPVDQLFPNYIADSVQGPIAGQAGGYWGVKPGVPMMDIIDDYGAGPLKTGRTIAGSLNPLAKVPMELLFQKNARTGADIKDWTDYVDQQIPNATYANKLAGGRSLSSGFTQDTYEAPSNTGFSSGTGLTGGENTFLNWLLGGGITDYSKPSSIKSAQFDVKDFLKTYQGGK